MAQLERMFAEIRAQVDAVDIVVNNAGRGSGPGFPQLGAITEADYDACFALNAKGTFFVTQQAVAMMPDGGRVCPRRQAVVGSKSRHPLAAGVQHAARGACDC